jgi:hypothetical protein
MDMDKILKIVLGTILIVGIIAITIVSIGFSMNNKDKPIIAMGIENYEIQTRTIDSLHNVIGNLQSDIKILEEGFDSREHRYEDVLLDYEIGLSYLKDYHPTAYKDFHRIVGMRERYTHELEKENNKHLKLEKWD